MPTLPRGLVNAMALRDTYANGAIQPDARIYTQFDANYNVTALIGYNASAIPGALPGAHCRNWPGPREEDGRLYSS